ncbi:hypothetical protein LTR84_012925 [Exophiala bonariae]|uniref:F-box domain-containing protein n=1 Tax=Exophiala bonariae TaxID=1690606 RepID=A0AAV9NDM5_9EURO|nr:hypothetical protein LTR84_012925 [Exophiala bonariae]
MLKTLSACLLDCQTAVKDKKYDVALAALKTALQVSRKNCKEDYVNILDHRVAVYLNMEFLDLAFKDAKSMVRSDQKDGRGYLRCGQIERLLGNQNAAINWYKQGLKRVSSTHRAFPSLQKQLAKVESQLKKDVVFTKANDPMLALPLETVEFILSYLTYREVVGMTRVSRPWNKLFCGLRPIIDTIDYGAANKPVSAHMLRASLRKLRVAKSITATEMDKSGEAFIIKHLQVTTSLRELSHLELKLNSYPLRNLPWSKYNLKSLVLSGLSAFDGKGFGIEHVRTVLRDCPRLEALSVHNLQSHAALTDKDLNCPALRRLVLHDPSKNGVISQMTSSTLETMPNLEELSLRGVTVVPIHGLAIDLRKMALLKILHLREMQWRVSRIYLPVMLQDLRLGDQGLMANTAHPPEESFTSLTNLTSLDLVLEKHWPEYLAASLMPAPGDTKLSELRLSVNPEHADTVLQLLGSGSARKLRLLKLDGCQWLKDNHSGIFTTHLPELEDLTLGAAAITGVFIMDLIKAPRSRLKKVQLTNCNAVSGDIKPWAQGHGVNLTIKKPGITNGQRVREAH